MYAVCIIGSVYWKLVRVAVNVCSVHYRVFVLEITVGLCVRDRETKDKAISKMQHRENC